MFVPSFVEQLTVQATPVQWCVVLMTEHSTPQLKSSTMMNRFSLAEHIWHIVIGEAMKTWIRKQTNKLSIAWWSWDESHSWVWKTASDLIPKHNFWWTEKLCEVVSISELQSLIIQTTFKTSRVVLNLTTKILLSVFDRNDC